MKKILLIFIGCAIAEYAISQPLFTYGTNEVSKDEFIRAFNKNITRVENKEQALKEYIDLYSKYKLKVKSAKELKLDTLDQLKYDMMNFKSRLEIDYPVDIKEAMVKTNFRRNAAIKDEDLFRFADSVTLIQDNRKYPIEKQAIFSIANTPVKTAEWLSFVKEYKLNYNAYKGESYPVLLDSFISKTVAEYYRNHLEDYNEDFKYQLQEFKEGNLMYEVMDKKVWNKSTSDNNTLIKFYEDNKDRFLWQESAEVILVSAKYFAYADYASENMKNGLDWRKIAAGSEGMIIADSGRYEIAQLPLKPGAKLVEGEFTQIVKNDSDNGASFLKVVKIYPVKMQRTFEEAKSLVINEYQKQLEESWMNDLAKRYPVKVNNTVLQTLLK